ncbi:MAG: SBBP repeat-containing protein, partial [candidate division WOR-3 bacterium]
QGSGTTYDYLTLKYDSEGNLLWERRYNGPGNGVDEAHALFVDENRNIYIAGRSVGSGTNYDYATLKYNSDGNLLWERRYNGPGNGGDEANALFVDGNGNVYVTGSSQGSGTTYDYLTLKYDSEGNLLWERRYNGPGNGVNEAHALFVDGNRNIYITGRSVGSGTNYDYATIKYVQGVSISEEKENKLKKRLTKRDKIYDITGKLIEGKLRKGIYFQETGKEIKKILILK